MPPLVLFIISMSQGTSAYLQGYVIDIVLLVLILHQFKQSYFFCPSRRIFQNKVSAFTHLPLAKYSYQILVPRFFFYIFNFKNF